MLANLHKERVHQEKCDFLKKPLIRSICNIDRDHKHKVTNTMQKLVGNRFQAFTCIRNKTHERAYRKQRPELCNLDYPNQFYIHINLTTPLGTGTK
jgi:hypothetical protein